MRYKGPKNRVARREGIDLGLKTPGTKSHARLLKKLNVPPGQHGTRGKRKVSERGRQLRETQKLKFIFGLSTRQLKNYFKKAKQSKGNTALFLSQFIEKRLDNIIFRLGFAPTRASARQMVVHKHIKVNDKMINIPSYQVKIDDLITIGDAKIQKTPEIERSIENKDLILPVWLERKAVAGRLISTPLAELIEKQLNLRLVIEYYSR